MVDEWADVLSVPVDRVRHIALLPANLAAEVGALPVPVVTWEQVAEAYRLVGPAYWVGVLDMACERWESLVAAPRAFGRNMEAQLSGQQLVDLAQAEVLDCGYMGRRGGLTGERLAEDISTGRWRSQMYEVRSEALPGNANWFAIAPFVDLITSLHGSHPRATSARPTDGD